MKAIIAIDGPVAVGKSTVGRLVAERLGHRFVDTGAMYRALTWKALGLGINLKDEARLTQLAANTRIDLLPPEDGEEGDGAVLVDGCDISPEIHTPEVESGVSPVAKVAGVRKILVSQQRRMAEKSKLVMVGRDIGTVVLPQADLKVYLVASAEERARRRYQELIARGQRKDYPSILHDLRLRDETDSLRATSPLRPASDAEVIDTEGLSLEEVVEAIYALAGGN
jgi:cytidylate kinase